MARTATLQARKPARKAVKDDGNAVRKGAALIAQIDKPNFQSAKIRQGAAGEGGKARYREGGQPARGTAAQAW